MPPNGAVVAGGKVVIDLVAMNPGSVEVAFEPAPKLSGLLTTSTGSWPVELRTTGPAPTAVAPGAFAVHRYSLMLPLEAKGRAVLDVTQSRFAPLRTVLDLTTAPSGTANEPLTPLSELASSTKVIDTVINRTFAGRLTPNDPV